MHRSEDDRRRGGATRRAAATTVKATPQRRVSFRDELDWTRPVLVKPALGGLE